MTRQIGVRKTQDVVEKRDMDDLQLYIIFYPRLLVDKDFVGLLDF